MENEFDRRDFLKKSLAAAAGLGLTTSGGLFSQAKARTVEESKGLIYKSNLARTEHEFNINLDRLEEKISPLCFGHNLEHTRSAMWNGLSAQMIRNRKFAGKPEPSGQAMEWYPIGSRRSLFYLEYGDERPTYTRHTKPYPRHVRRINEICVQYISGFRDRENYGIGQDGIHLQQGKQYETRLALRAAKPMTVSVRFLSENKNRVYYSRELSVSDGDWTESNFEFRAPHTDPGARIEITFSGVGELAVGAVSLLPVNNFHGMRPDVVELLKKIGAPLLRWPGGNFAGDYRWQDGLIEVDKRGPLQAATEIETLPHTFGYDMHEVGIDEFMALCREVGAEPFISVNIAWDSPEEIAAFVEYCNGSANTKWGKIRVDRGHKEPYNVKYWSMGNELGYGHETRGDHMEGPNQPSDYAVYTKKVVKLIRDVDSTVEIVISGRWHPESEWFEEALIPLAQDIHHVQYHTFSAPFNQDTSDGRYKEDKITEHYLNYIVPNSELRFDALSETRAKLNETVPAGTFIGISWDEWNLWYSWYRRPGVMEGMFVASKLDALCKHAAAKGVTLCCYFQPVNEGAIIINPTFSELTPGGHAFSLYKAHHGNRKVSATSQKENEFVKVTASLDEEAQVLVVTLLNLNLESSSVSLNFTAGGRLELSDGQHLTGQDILPGSRFLEKPVEIDLSDNLVAVSLPKLSVTRLRFNVG